LLTYDILTHHISTNAFRCHPYAKRRRT